jgi:hypothetical protein
MLTLGLELFPTNNVAISGRMCQIKSCVLEMFDPHTDVGISTLRYQIVSVGGN